MLPSTSLREALLACPPFPPRILLFSLWSPLFLLHALALISLSLAKVRLSLTSTLYYITSWCSKLTALFLFFLAKAALAYLPAALFVALRPLFPFQQAQYAPAFLLKLALSFKLIAGLHFSSLLLLSGSRSVLSSVFPFTSNSLTGTVFFLLPFYQATMGPRTLVSPGKRRG